MKLSGILLGGALIGLAFLISKSGSSSPGDPRDVVEVGSSVEYTFRDSLVNGRGLTELSSLQGKPVLVEFWGTR